MTIPIKKVTNRHPHPSLTVSAVLPLLFLFFEVMKCFCFLLIAFYFFNATNNKSSRFINNNHKTQNNVFKLSLFTGRVFKKSK